MLALSKNSVPASQDHRSAQRGRFVLAMRHSLLSITIAAAYTYAPYVLAAQATKSPETRQYNIAAGPLEGALSTFAQQAGITLSIAPGVALGKTTQGLSGSYNSVEGLRRLIGNNDLRVALESKNAFRIEATGTAPKATSKHEIQSTSDTMVVTASAGSVEQDVQNAPASISVITKQELESKPYRDIADAISSVPGVIATGGSDRKEISIRGMGSAYTMTMIDGMPTDSRETSRLSDGLGQMNAWTPPVSAIERIEVVRGPMSSLYGADALGGVINIITRKVPKEWTGEVSTDGLLQEHSRSGNGNQENFFLSGPLKDGLLGLQVYGQYSGRDEDKIYYGYRGSRRSNLTGKLSLTPNPDQDFLFEANHTTQHIWQEPGKTLDPGCVTYSYTGCADPFSKTVDVNRYSMSHTGRWAFGTSQTFIQQENFDIHSQDVQLKNTEFRTSWAIPMGLHVVTVGGDLKHSKLHDAYSNTVTDVDDISRTQKALFAEDAWYMTDSFTLTTGMRMDDDDRFGTHYSPRIYGVWSMTPEWTLKGGVTSGFKSPDLTETARGYATASGIGNLYGNPDLNPEKSLNQEIGLLYKNDDGVQGGLTLFNNQFKNKITNVACASGDACYALSGGTGYYGPLVPQTYANVDRAITRGVEATLDLPLARNVTLDNTYTYTYSRQDSGAYKGKPLNMLPVHLLTSTLNYKATAALATWARMTFRGKDSENVGGTDAVLFPTRAPSYTMFDVGATYEINKTLSVRATIYNLADKRVGYGDYGYVEDGRRLWVGMTAKF